MLLFSNQPPLVAGNNTTQLNTTVNSVIENGITGILDSFVFGNCAFEMLTKVKPARVFSFRRMSTVFEEHWFIFQVFFTIISANLDLNHLINLNGKCIFADD